MIQATHENVLHKDLHCIKHFKGRHKVETLGEIPGYGILTAIDMAIDGEATKPEEDKEM